MSSSEEEIQSFLRRSANPLRRKRLLTPSSESIDDEILTQRSSRRRRYMVSSSSNDSDSSSFSKPLKKKCKVLPDTNSESSQPSGSDSEDYLGITNSHRKKQIISSGPESFSEGESSHKNPAMVAEANSSDDDGDKCIICFKTLRPPFAHPSNCEHNFHPVCLSTWSKTSNTCPIDRVQYTAVVVVDHNGRLVSREGVTTPPPQNHNADFELDDATFCEVCSQHDREHELLLCDRCEAGYHLNCLDPPLSSIPEGNWFCPHCAEIHDELSEEMQSLLDDAAVLLTPRFRPRAPVTRTSRGPRTRGAQRVFNIIHHQETIGQPSTSTSSVTIQRRQMTSRRSSGRSRGSRCPRSARYKVELITVEDGTTLEVKVAVNTRSRTKSKKRLKKSSKKKCSKSSCKNEPSSRSCDQSMCSSQGPSQSLDLFGSRPQLDYFSGCEAEDELDEDGGGGLAVLRSAARPNVRSMANRKQCAAQILNTSQRRVTPRINVSRAPVDLVSSIIEQQEKWHNPNAIYHTDGRGRIDVTLKENSRIRQTAGGSSGSTSSGGVRPSADGSTARASSSRMTPSGQSSAGSSCTSEEGFHPLQPPPEPPSRLYEDDDFDLYADIEPPNSSKLAPPPEPPAALFALDGDEKEVAEGGGNSSPEDSGLVIDDRHDTYDPEMPTSPPTSPGPNNQTTDAKTRETNDGPNRISEPPSFLNRLPPPPSPPDLLDDEFECPNQGMYSKISMEIAKGNENSDEEEILPPPPPPPFGTLDLRTVGQQKRTSIPEQEVFESSSFVNDNVSNDVDFNLANIPQPLDIPVPDGIPFPKTLPKSPNHNILQEDVGINAKVKECAADVESSVAEELMENVVLDKMRESEDHEETDEEEAVAEEATAVNEEDTSPSTNLHVPAKVLQSKLMDKELSEGELDEDDGPEEQMGDVHQGGQNFFSASASAESNKDHGHMDDDEPQENGSAEKLSDDGVMSDGDTKVEKDASFHCSQGSLSPREDKASHYTLSSVVKKVNSSGSNEGDDMLELACEEERDGLVDITDEEISNYEKSWEMEDCKKRQKGAGLDGLETEAISDCEYPPPESDPVGTEKQEDPTDALSAEDGAVENGNKEEEGEITTEEKVPVQWKKLQKDKLKDRSYRGDKDMKNKEKKKEIIKKKEKRKELERYNVRKLISEKPRRKVDEFGRDISSHSESSSPSLSPVSRGRRSTSKTKKRRSRSPSMSRERMKEQGRSRERARERSRGRTTETSQDRSKEKLPRRERSKERKSRSRSKKRSRRSRSPRKERNRSREKSSRERKKRKKSPSLSCSSCSCSSCEREKRRSKKLTVIVPNESVVTERSREKPKLKYREKQRGSSPKRRKRSSPVPSKEVFTSGDNILVSVNFKSSKSGESMRTKESSQSSRRKKDDESRKKKEKVSKENQPVRSVVADKKSNRRKLNTKNIKPIAIIDLDASPFRETILSPKEVIILTDSDCEDKMAQDGEIQAIPALSITGPKTPPEPHIKFNIINNKQQQLRQMSNPLMELSMEQEDEEDEGDEDENDELNAGHKGPNTPPEPPVPYDPFEPTKSRSPTPGPEADADRRSPADSRGQDEPAQTSHTPPPKQQHEAPKTPSPLHSPPAPKVSDGGGDNGNTIQSEKGVKAPIFPPTTTVTVDSGDDSPAAVGGGGDSPYSPGSSEGDDLFEPPLPTTVPSVPPPTKTKSRLPPLPSVGTQNSKHLLPLPKISSSSSKKRLSKMHKESSKKGAGKKEIGIKLDEDQLKILDELPNSAVEMQVKDKFLKKLNRQERVVEEVKMVLKPHYAKKHVTKEEYKEILRKAVPKICHSRSGEINPIKIHRLIEAYVKKYRHKSAKKKPAVGGPTGAVTLRQNKTKTLWC